MRCRGYVHFRELTSCPTSEVYRKPVMTRRTNDEYRETGRGGTARPARVAFFGDLNGGPGRRVLAARIEEVRRDHAPDLIIANAENLRNGSGITPDLYRTIRDLGIDGVTLGDHVYRDRRIIPLLEDPDEPICRPANLSNDAPGKRGFRLPLPSDTGGGDFLVFNLLGRVYMGLPANDPFQTADELIAANPNARGILIDAHMEATAEKAALAFHLDGRVSAVLGTHTHVPTADHRILTRGTAFQSDVGMCGPFASIIGRAPEQVIRHMRTSVHTPYEMGSGDERLCGTLVTFRTSSRLASEIKPFQYGDRIEPAEEPSGQVL